MLFQFIAKKENIALEGDEIAKEVADKSDEEEESEVVGKVDEDELTEGENNESPDDKSDEDNEDNQDEEVELHEPDEEVQGCKEYVNELLGKKAKELTLYTAEQVNRPLYCVSVNPKLNSLTPVPSSQDYDVLPRLVAATSLLGCINGRTTLFVGTPTHLFNNPLNLYTIYEIPFQYAVKPNKTFVKQVEYTDEYWLIQWQEEAKAFTPEITAQMQMMMGGEGQLRLLLQVKDKPLYITPKQKLSSGYYQIDIPQYQPNYPLESKEIKVVGLSEANYRRLTSYSIMLKNK